MGDVKSFPAAYARRLAKQAQSQADREREIARQLQAMGGPDAKEAARVLLEAAELHDQVIKEMEALALKLETIPNR